MKHLEKLKETLMNELEMFAKKGDVSINTLEKIHKLTDTIKNIDKICMLEEEGGYSEDYGSSYARGRGRYAKRDSMGRYSRDGGYPEEGGSYRGSSYDDDMSYARGGQGGRGGNMGGRGGYSRDDAKDHMMHKLGDMMEDADPKEREALKECMRAIERA